MKQLYIYSLILALIAAPAIYAQKGKHKGGGNKKGDVNININIDQSKGGHDHDHDGDKKHHGHEGDQGHDGDHNDNGWHNGHHKREHVYKGNTIFCFFGPGDIYNCKGKNKKERIVVYDDVCVRLGTNITFMFGMLGDIRIKLDGKKAKMEPERYKKLKIEIGLLDDELKVIEIKKQKIKLRLAKLKEDKD
jgi:hypothetical protein